MNNELISFIMCTFCYFKNIKHHCSNSHVTVKYFNDEYNCFAEQGYNDRWAQLLHDWLQRVVDSISTGQVFVWSTDKSELGIGPCEVYDLRI